MNKSCDDCENCRMHEDCYPHPGKIYDAQRNVWIDDPFHNEETCEYCLSLVED